MNEPEEHGQNFTLSLVSVTILLVLILGGRAFVTVLLDGPNWMGHLGRVTPTGWAGWGWLAAWVVAALPLVLIRLWSRQATAPASRWTWRGTAWGLSLALACFLVGGFVVVALHTLGLLPATQAYLSDRDLIARMRDGNNLKHLGVAAGNHAADLDRLPAGCLVDARGVPIHGWPVQLLPYLEQNALSRLVQRDKPWDDPSNRRAFQTQVSPLEAVAASHRDADGYALNFFASNVHVLGGDRPRRVAEFAEQGTSNVLLFGEVGGDLKPWGHPIQWRDPALGLNAVPHGFGTPSAATRCSS
jgi:hypothetical protein